MKLFPNRPSRRACIAGIGLLVLPVASLHAQPYIYTGGATPEAPASANWLDDTKWADGLAPSSSLDTELVFGGSGTGGYTATNNFGNFDLNRITFNSTSTGLVTLNSGTLNFLDNSSATGPRITQDGSGRATINSAISLGNSLTLDGSGTGDLTLTGVISGAGGLTKSGSGLVTLSGTVANTYTGLTTVSGGELVLNRFSGNNLYNAITGNITVGNGTVSLGQSNQIIDTATMTITEGGTFKLNARSETLEGINISSTNPGAIATIDLGNQTGSTTLWINNNLTLGENTALIGGGSLRRTGGNLALNLDGGHVGGDLINVGSNGAGTTINITKNAGDGSGTLVVGGNAAATTSTVNLNQTGSIDLGVKITAQSNATGSKTNALHVNIANTATGMSGGIITTALPDDINNPAGPNRIYTEANNQLTFAAGGAGFDLSGGVLDVRSASNTATFGSITTNGNNLTISGGALLGNRLVGTSGAITLSDGLLALRDTRAAAADHFTISTTDGSDGRTIKMLSGDTGTFSVANATASTNYIAIGAQTDGGTWDRGSINAGQNYTITADTAGALAFGSSFATYTIADNSGLYGVALGANAVPTQLFLGENAGFFGTSTAAARTYNIGTDSLANDIVVQATGGFAFGVNNTVNNVANAQVINLNRDKGDSNVILVANGANSTNAINLTTDQTGSGNLYVATKILTLNEGVTFGGTGGIYTDASAGDAHTQAVLGGGIVNVNGANTVPIIFNINGTLNGTNTINLNQDNAISNGGSFVIGANAVIGGTQTWWGGQILGGAYNSIFANNLTNPANWTGTVALGAAGPSGSFEASTSTASPSTSSNYKFTSLTLLTPGTSSRGHYRLVNNVQNDGGSGKEAFYTSAMSVGGGISDSSGGRYIFNLNGQDLYVDRLSNITGANARGLVWQNDALDSVSQIRAVDVQGDNLTSGSFAVLNGATLEVAGGNYNAVIFNRHEGAVVSDNAAVPNAPSSTSEVTLRQTQSWDGTSRDIGASVSFLGSGTESGANTNSDAKGTDGTFRVIGGTFASSGYILNALGTTGTIDTTGAGDTTLNDVKLRGNASQAVTGTNGNSWLTLGTEQLYSVGDAVQVAGTTPGFASNILYYVVEVSGNQVRLSTTQGGAPINATGTINAATLRDAGGAGSASAFPALIVAGTTNIVGNLVLANAPGATNQATLRVGGVTASVTPVESGTAELNVIGDLTTGATNNIAIQSNGSVRVGGDVAIAGVGINLANNVTGTGVGIHADSHFTVNGNTGASTAQTINIAPTVGHFHVGDGSAGTLTGTAAQAVLAANLTSASGVDINGASSSLNLGGFTLTANGTGLTVGGGLTGNGTVVGTTTFLSGGALNPGNSPGLVTFNDTATFNSGSSINIEINGAGTRGTDFDGVNFDGGVTITGGTLSFNFSSTLAEDSLLNIFDGSALTSTFDSVVASGSYNGSFALNEGGTAYVGQFGGQEITFTLASGELYVAAGLIPEPASASALAAVGALALAALRRRRRN